MQLRTNILIAFLAAAIAGCSPAQYAHLADRAALRTLRRGQRAAMGNTEPFDIRYRPFCPSGPRSAFIRVGKKAIPLGKGKTQKLTLDECLHIALRNSRSFQNHKEQLYSDALALASARREWDWDFLGGSAAGDVSREKVNGNASGTNSASGGLGLTFSQKFFSGAQLALGTTVSLASDLLGIRSTAFGSLLEANLTQPLLRGAWYGFAYEDVYRQERDFVFSVYDFERFTQTFAVEIVKEYYDVLQQRDRLENERENIERLKQTQALTRVLVQGGQRSRIELDQAEQNLLDAQVRFEQLQQQYENARDQFKITLGLPISARMDVDYPAALEELNHLGPLPVSIDEPHATAVALSVRPDVLTARASLRDARRDVEIAANNFLPSLNLELGISAPGTDPRGWTRVRFNRQTRTASLAFNYNIDQTANRDAYRNAVIAYNKAKRDYEQFEDNVRLQVRRSYRSLLQSRRSYDLQKRSVDIARRRRKLASLQQRAGQASARDVLEAEEALRQAQNGLTSALITYTTTRLEFFANLGLLRLDKKGNLHERNKPFGFGAISRRFREAEAPRP